MALMYTRKPQIPTVMTVALLLLPTLLSASLQAAPIVWSGNGHQYEAVFAPGLSWEAAEAAAEAAGGHLATITSAEEDTFVMSLFENNPAFWFVDGFNNALGPWFGGTQSPCTPEPACGWGWVTGETFSYTNWSPHDPDNCCGVNQNRLEFIRDNNSPPTRWTDVENFAGFVRGYILEIEGTVSVDESPWGSVKQLYR